MTARPPSPPWTFDRCLTPLRGRWHVLQTLVKVGRGLFNFYCLWFWHIVFSLWFNKEKKPQAKHLSIFCSIAENGFQAFPRCRLMVYLEVWLCGSIKKQQINVIYYRSRWNKFTPADTRIYFSGKLPALEEGILEEDWNMSGQMRSERMKQNKNKKE